ncbi:MAG TPA: hypothetical protein VF338_05830, partial [Leptolinea sp.]
MKTQNRRLWIPAIVRKTLVGSIRKSTFSEGLIGLGALLVLLVAAVVYQPAAANSSAQSTGYWQFVENKNYLDDKGVTIEEIEINEGGGQMYRSGVDVDGKPTNWNFKCTWMIIPPKSLDKLMPGDKVEGTASCTDSSQTNTFGGSGVTFSIEPPGIPSYAGGIGDAFELNFGFHESKTDKGTLIVPAIPQ